MATTTNSPSNTVLIALLIAIVVAIAVYVFVRTEDNTETIRVNTPAGRIEATVPSND